MEDLTFRNYLEHGSQTADISGVDSEIILFPSTPAPSNDWLDIEEHAKLFPVLELDDDDDDAAVVACVLLSRMMLPSDNDFLCNDLHQPIWHQTYITSSVNAMKLNKKILKK